LQPEQLLGDIPQPLGIHRIERVASDAAQVAGSAVHRFGFVAIDEIASSDTLEQW